MNILYIHSHDTGRAIQPYGFPVSTPNAQRFAEEGVLFRNAFSAAPTCSPSRAALVTGQYPHQCGMFGLAHGWFSLNDYSKHIANVLRERAGYYSQLIGFQHVVHWHDADVIGYDRVVGGGNDGARARDIVEPTRKFFDNPPDEPWFLSVGITETHRFGEPHNFSGKEQPMGDSRYVPPPPTCMDTPANRQEFADYAEAAKRLDTAVGRILDALDSQGLAEDTLVLWTTDHGLPFPRSKCTLYDAGTGVLMMMRGPGGFDGGQVIDQMVTQLDFFPTLCDLIDIEPPQWLEGKSILPLTRGDCDKLHQTVYTEQTWHAYRLYPLRAARTDRLKYIRKFQPEGHLRTRPGGFWQFEPQNAGTPVKPENMEELYDLQRDPHEQNDLSDKAEMQETLDNLRERTERWMKETNDPLARGEIPLPETVTASSE